MQRIAIASFACCLLFGACTQPNSAAVPYTNRSQTVPQRARDIYFAGIQLANGAGGGGFLGPGELGVYAATANGNVAPAHVLVGDETGLLDAGGCCVPQSAWFDAAQNAIWTCRTFSKYISTFSANSWGDVAPVARLRISPKTVSCGGVALASNGDIVADDINKAFVATWPAHSTGSAPPIRTIAGRATQLYLPSQIAFDSQGEYIVTDRCAPPKCSKNLAGEILTFAANADGNVAPLRAIAGSKTLLAEPNRIAYDPVHNLIYAANLSTSTITAYPAGASGNVVPTIYIAGTNTHLWNPDAIAIDGAGYLYVGNEPEVPGPPPASIVVFAPGANGNATPVQVIQGSKTKLAEVNGITVH